MQNLFLPGHFYGLPIMLYDVGIYIRPIYDISCRKTVYCERKNCRVKRNARNINWENRTNEPTMVSCAHIPVHYY